jgi:hypothetical protein
LYQIWNDVGTKYIYGDVFLFFNCQYCRTHQ